MATIAAVVVLAFDLVERLRRTLRHRLPPPESRHDWSIFAITQLGAGAAVALLLVGYEVLLGNAISATSVDALHFSLHPLVSARLAFALGLLLAQAVVFWSGIVIVMMMTLPWRVPRSGGIALAAFALQALPVLAISIFPRVIGAAPSTVPAVPTAFAGLACLALAWGMVWVRPRYRHASQALRLFAGALVLLIPAYVLYPSVHHFADRGLRRLDRRRVRAPGQRPAARAAGQAANRAAADRRARHAEPRGAAPPQPVLVEPGVRNVGEHQSRDRAPRIVARALRRRRPAGRAPVRAEPSRLCLDGADLARAELRLGDLRGGVAVRIRRAPAVPCRPWHLRTELGHSHWRIDRRQRDARLRDAAVHHRAQPVQRADSSGRLAAARGISRPLGAVRRLRMGARIALLVEHPRVSTRRHAAWTSSRSLDGPSGRR